MLNFSDFIRNGLHIQPYSFNYINLNDFVSWSDVNLLLSSELLDYPRVRIVCADNEYSKGYSGFLRYSCSDRGERIGRIIPGVLYKAMREGGTIIVDRCEAFFPQIKSLVREISVELGCQAWANLYISSQGTSGFGCHFDDHDVLAIQVCGSKSWDIYEPTYQSPSRGDKSFYFPQPKGKPLKTEILSAGRGLYLPSGYWHSVKTLSDISLHVTIGMDFLRRADVLRLLCEKLSSDSFFREKVKQGDTCELKNRIIKAVEQIDLESLIDKKQGRLAEGSQKFSFPEYGSKL